MASLLDQFGNPLCRACGAPAYEFHRAGCLLLPRAAVDADPDGPLVPLPAKPAPLRVPPPFPLTAYQALIR